MLSKTSKPKNILLYRTDQTNTVRIQKMLDTIWTIICDYIFQICCCYFMISKEEKVLCCYYLMISREVYCLNSFYMDNLEAFLWMTIFAVQSRKAESSDFCFHQLIGLECFSDRKSPFGYFSIQDNLVLLSDATVHFQPT